MKTPEELLRATLFSGIGDKNTGEYISLFRARSFAKGEIILSEGDLCTGLVLLLKGEAAIQKYTCDGDFVTISLLLSGEYFGEEMIFSGKEKYAYTLEAVSPAEILLISKDVLLPIMEKHPQVKDNFLKILSSKVESQNRRIALLSQKSTRQKTAFYLLELCREQGSEREVELPVSKEVISKLLAMPRPSLSRELLSMEQEGLIRLNKKSITILDASSLEHDVTDR